MRVCVMMPVAVVASKFIRVSRNMESCVQRTSIYARMHHWPLNGWANKFQLFHLATHQIIELHSLTLVCDGQCVRNIYTQHTHIAHCINSRTAHFNRSIIIISYHQSGLENRKLNFKTLSNTLALQFCLPFPSLVSLYYHFCRHFDWWQTWLNLISKVLHSTRICICFWSL